MILTRLTKLMFLFVVIISTLILGKAIFIPLAFALIISFLFYPLAAFFEKRMSRILAVTLVFLIVSIGFILLAFIGIQVVRTVLSDMQDFEPLLNDFMDQLAAIVVEVTGLSLDKLNLGLKKNIGTLLSGPLSFITQQLINSGSILFSALITGIFTYLMLLYRTVFKKFILSQIAQESRSEVKAILYDVQKVSQKYILGLLLVMFILGILNSLGLWAIGVKYPLFWGFFAAILTIVPYAGTFAGGFFPFLFTLLTTSTVWQPIAVIALFFIVQFLEDNLIKPKVIGGQIDLNPFTAILALLIGGLIWGIPGFVLALPYMAMTKIILEHFEETKALATLFSSEVYDEPEIFSEKYSHKRYSLRNFLKPKK